MDLKYIEAFLKVVEKGSFSAAAQALYITQPTLSNRIQRLEQSLNTKLFQRGSGEKAVLLEKGKNVYAYYKSGYEMIQRGTELFFSDARLRVPMVISTPNHLGEHILSEIIEVIKKIQPQINFLLEINESAVTLEKISKGEADIGIAYLLSAKEINSLEGLEVHNIATEDIILVCSPQHNLTKLDEVTIEHLKEEHIILTNKKFKGSNEVDKFLHRHGSGKYKTIESKNIEWLKNMVKKLSGVSFLLRNIVSDDIKKGELIELPFYHDLPEIPIVLAFRKGLDDTIKSQVVEVARKQFKDILNQN